MTGCGTAEDLQTSQTTSSSAQSEMAPQICTKDINQHGQPSDCRCEAGYQYDNQLGMCQLNGRLTTELKWNPDSESLQAQLYDLMLRNEILDLSVISISDENNSIKCETGTQGMIAVQQYKCGLALEGAQLNWNSNSESLQAKLYNLISYASPEKGLNPQVSLSDKQGNKINCAMGTVGMAQVVSYRCSVELKSVN
jgi:hypothetical protein